MENNTANNNTISEKELDQVVETLSATKSERNRELQEIIDTPTTEAKQTPIEIIANVTVDNESGMAKLSTVEDNNARGIDEVLEEGEIEADLNNPDVVKTLASSFGISEMNETLKVVDVLKEYKANPKGAYFGKLPSEFKRMAVALMSKSGVNQEEAARDLLDLMNNTIKEDQTIVDFNDSITKTYNELNLNVVSEYGKYLKEIIEDKMVKGAEKMEAEGNMAGALKTRSIIDAFKKSYTLTPLFDFIENNKSFVRKLRKELKRADRWVRDFNYKYHNSRMKIKNVQLMINPILRSKESEVTLEEVEKVLILFAKCCQNYSPDNVAEHTFMFYFIHHAVSLDYLLPEDELFKEYTENFVKLVRRIEEIESER